MCQSGQALDLRQISGYGRVQQRQIGVGDSAQFPTKRTSSSASKASGARKPILLSAHVYVVEAKREDWTTGPFTLIEKYG